MPLRDLIKSYDDIKAAFEVVVPNQSSGGSLQQIEREAYQYSEVPAPSVNRQSMGVRSWYAEPMRIIIATNSGIKIFMYHRLVDRVYRLLEQAEEDNAQDFSAKLYKLLSWYGDFEVISACIQLASSPGQPYLTTSRYLTSRGVPQAIATRAHQFLVEFACRNPADMNVQNSISAFEKGLIVALSKALAPVWEAQGPFEETNGFYFLKASSKKILGLLQLLQDIQNTLKDSTTRGFPQSQNRRVTPESGFLAFLRNLVSNERTPLQPSLVAHYIDSQIVPFLKNLNKAIEYKFQLLSRQERLRFYLAESIQFVTESELPEIMSRLDKANDDMLVIAIVGLTPAEEGRLLNNDFTPVKKLLDNSVGRFATPNTIEVITLIHR